jgi:uncharacterized protein YjbJ (UPF0337 family)
MEGVSGNSNDSKFGKLMEKAGNMMGNENLAAKGLEKREAKGYGQESSDD